MGNSFASPPTITDLYIYPVKSLAGIALQEAAVDERGLRWDRRWMIVDEGNNFVTQRTVPMMATIKTAVTQEGALTLCLGGVRIDVPACADDSPREDVQVWDSLVPAIKVSQTVNALLSEYLSFPCSLVYMPDDTRRAIDPDYAIGDEIVSFADGYPVLLANSASLDDLNQRIGDAGVPMNRFRPNIVVETTDPFLEDGLGKFQLGSAILEGVKPCSRCPVTTIDQHTGEKTGKEPLKTLATFRRGMKGVNFGENLVVRQTGMVRIGDAIETLAARGIYPRSIRQ